MISSKINLHEKFSKFSKHWSPRVIAEMNNYQFKIAKIKENLFGTIIKILMKLLLLLKVK